MRRFLFISILFIGLFAPLSQPAIAQVVEVVVEDPTLHPTYTTCPETYWYPFANNRGHTAYLTLNVSNPSNSTNYGEWHPVISQTGYYRVEAYIAAHNAITWCSGQHPIIPHDTTEARYSIHHANGVTNRSLSQYPLRDQWLDLGEYYFTAGQSGYVHLADLNGEPDFSTTISFSAMRFTFTRLTRPNIYLPFVLYSDPSGRPPPDVGVLQGQGFDACHLPEASEMQAWWDHSPYSFYALYIGGIHLPSVCAVASADWVRAVHQQGWSFVPTWVGPQAPCTDYHYRMSNDPVVSYQQGRAEAQAASSAAVTMGFTNSGMGGTIIYYDLEAYGVSTPTCRQPVAAFMNGWVERLHELGNLAGGYGTRNSYPADWAAVAHVPNDVWAASWYSSNYDPYATVNGITWIEGLWINHQRIKQYAGDVGNTWGGISMSIDINVADGQVALPPLNPLSEPIITPTASIEDAGWISEDIGWLISAQRLYWTNTRGVDWLDVSPAEVLKADFLPTGQAWALSPQGRNGMMLYRSSNQGLTWQGTSIELPVGNWYPLQLEFSSSTSGWIVLQLQTSQAFDVGLLLKTEDGGQTWHNASLPTASSIRFISAAEGWLVDGVGKARYHTMDGGETWQPAREGVFQPDSHLYPENTILSGWQAVDLGWAVASTSDCSGEKGEPGFACTVSYAFTQTNDGGITWKNIPLPTSSRVLP